MTDIGLAATGLAAAICFAFGRGQWLRRILFAAWLCGAIVAMTGPTRDVMVFWLASIDLAVAMTALVRFTQDPTKRTAQLVGLLSLVLMPAHSTMALSHGHADWTIYASACNAIFVLQCLTAGGWLDGLGRSIAGIWRRMHPLHPVRDRGR